jgi:hypothetical protein
MHVAHRRPDGTFEYGGELYRLEDREHDRFVVRRLRDAKVVGGATEVDVVLAIARLLDGPRGIMPLQ